MTCRIVSLVVEGYRSISDPIEIRFPKGLPLVLLGENNAGKSNIVRALDLVLGEFWPGNHDPDDHEFWGRFPDPERPIKIQVRVSGVKGTYGRNVHSILWQHDGKEATYQARYDDPDPYRSATEGYVNNDIREQCTVVVIGANRNLDYQMSYRSKWTLLAKLMKKFHQALVEEEQRVQILRKKFQEIKSIFYEVGEFAQFEKALRSHFDTLLEGMSYGLGIDFSAYDPSNYFHSLRVYPTEGGEPRTFEELGTGQEQVLAFAFAHAYAKAFYGGIVLVVEEPEAHLHPLAKRWLARKIQQMARDGLQVVLTTHSPYFVNIMNLPGIVLVGKENGATFTRQLSAKELALYCTKHGAPSERVNEGNILPFYAANSTPDILSGLFAKKVVLVEGQTEQLALPIYLRRVGLDTDRAGIAIIPVMGKGNLARWWRFFTAYGLPTYVVFDNDKKDDGKATKRVDALRTLGIPADQVDGYITTDEWVVEKRFTVFGRNIEATLRKYFPSYEKLEKEAHQNLRSTAKPLVARYIAEHMPDEEIQACKELHMLKQYLVELS